MVVINVRKKVSEVEKRFYEKNWGKNVCKREDWTVISFLPVLMY